MLMDVLVMGSYISDKINEIEVKHNQPGLNTVVKSGEVPG